MERMLQKMARQLNAYDEASLVSLWDKYATVVERFEPTRRWEEAAVVFSLIQAVRLKNQLFNQHLAAGLEISRDGEPLPGLAQTRDWMEKSAKREEDEEKQLEPVVERKTEKRCKVLRFRRSKSDKPV